MPTPPTDTERDRDPWTPEPEHPTARSLFRSACFRLGQDPAALRGLSDALVRECEARERGTSGR